ncbi:MAG: epoxyqueuosine reductase QueH [Desulfobulbaceae bacterium]|nr:epoxyqueuosine reductase QueH [Desulfobulbaceae bacterium]
MKLLLHLCCGPCTTYPVTTLRSQGIKPQGFFHNPNIHPFREFKKRLGALTTVAAKMELPIHIDKEYGLTKYMRQVVFNEEKRCLHCYRMRLEATVEHAKKVGADAFSTTLLYSRYQQHNLIRRTAEELAAEHGIPFYYEDFRDGWQTGIDTAIEMDIYRQPYCGCIYSEQERYDKQHRRPVPPTSG